MMGEIPPVIQHVVAECRLPLCSSHSPDANLSACIGTWLAKSVRDV